MNDAPPTAARLMRAVALSTGRIRASRRTMATSAALLHLVGWAEQADEGVGVHPRNGLTAARRLHDIRKADTGKQSGNQTTGRVVELGDTRPELDAQAAL